MNIKSKKFKDIHKTIHKSVPQNLNISNSFSFIEKDKLVLKLTELNLDSYNNIKKYESLPINDYSWFEVHFTNLEQDKFGNACKMLKTMFWQKQYDFTLEIIWDAVSEEDLLKIFNSLSKISYLEFNRFYTVQSFVFNSFAAFWSLKIIYWKNIDTAMNHGLEIVRILKSMSNNEAIKQNIEKFIIYDIRKDDEDLI